MLHSPVFVILETPSSPCRDPASPWKGQGRSSPSTQQWDFVLDFKSCESLLLELLIYQYISTFEPSLQIQKCQITIRASFVWLRYGLTAARRDCPSVLLHFPSAFLEEQRFSHLCSIFMFLIYELILHYSLFPSEFPYHWHCLGGVFLTELWDAWSRVKFQWEKPPWRCSGLVLFNSGSSCGSGGGLSWLWHGEICVFVCDCAGISLLKR